MRLHAQHAVVRQLRAEGMVKVIAAAVAVGGVGTPGLLHRCKVLLHGLCDVVSQIGQRDSVRRVRKEARTVISYSGRCSQHICLGGPATAPEFSDDRLRKLHSSGVQSELNLHGRRNPNSLTNKPASAIGSLRTVQS